MLTLAEKRIGEKSLLSKTESGELTKLESIIETGLKTFVEVGSALLKIRDSRLYRATYRTFEDYCRERWGISKTHANRLIGSVSVMENLTPIGAIPVTESQIRTLTSFLPDQQRNVWLEAIEKAKSQLRPVTAMDVRDAVYKIKPHVAHNSGEIEWYTPPKYIEAARKVMGSIDLDPASSDIANRTIGAAQYYTKEDNGLEKIWTGNIWMNPPYSSNLIEQFSSKFAGEVNAGNIKVGIVLVNNATETIWFRELIGCASAVVFTTGRVHFLNPQGKIGAPLQGQAIIYSGDRPQVFLKEFKKFGWGATL